MHRILLLRQDVEMSICQFDLFNTSVHSSCPDAKDGKKRSSSDGPSASGPLSGGANPSSETRCYFPDARGVVAFEGIGEERNAAIGTKGSPPQAGWLVAKASDVAYLKETSVRGTGGSNPPLSAIQSVLFTYNLEMAANPRGTRRFCAQCEPEKAVPPLIRRIPAVFSPREE